MTEFKDVLSLSALRKYVKSEGFKQPTDVQAQAIPRLLAGKSLSVLAQTGSGKTLAYALPVVQMLKKLEKKKVTLMKLLRRKIQDVANNSHEMIIDKPASFSLFMWPKKTP